MPRGVHERQAAYTSVVELDTIESRTDTLSEAVNQERIGCSGSRQVGKPLASLCAKPCDHTVMSGSFW